MRQVASLSRRKYQPINLSYEKKGKRERERERGRKEGGEGRDWEGTKMRIIVVLISGLVDVSDARFKVEREKRNDAGRLVSPRDYLRLTSRGSQKISRRRSRVRE